jgi:hypothetical protein
MSILNNSLFIAYSTISYEPVTKIWKKSLEDNNIENINHKIDDDSQYKIFGFQTDSWYRFINNKLEHLLNVLIENKLSFKYKYFIFSDCDIQYFDINKQYWNQLEEFISKSNKSIFFMREELTTDVNTGFYIIKNNDYIDNIIRFFQKIIMLNKITPKFKAPLADQTIINNNKHTIEFDYIPNEYIVWGKRIFNKKKAIIHHAVCTRNIDEKLEQLAIISSIINNN